MFPNRIAVEITDACNLRCRCCGRPRNGHAMMTVKTFENILKVLNKNTNVTRLTLNWRGESTCSPFLPDIVECAEKNHFWTALSTNTATSNLHNECYVEKLLRHLNKLGVCIDGYNQETLQKYRVGAKWDVLMKNLETISSFTTKCRKEMRVLMFRYNENHEHFFLELGHKYGMEQVIFIAPYIFLKPTLAPKEAEEWLAENPLFQTYEQVGDIWRYQTSSTCRFAEEGPQIINVNGDVPICCWDWHSEHILGNILKDSIETMRKNWERFRPKMKRKKLDICTDCVALKLEAKKTDKYTLTDRKLGLKGVMKLWERL